MRVLALETSTSVGTVATLDSDTLLAEAELPRGQRSAQSLAPAIVNQLAGVGWNLSGVQLVATTRGPGSFTGLRIGVTTAKTLAYALGSHVIGLNTQEVIAAQSPPGSGRDLHVILDAQRQQLFAARYHRDASGHWMPVTPTAVIDIDTWLSLIAPPAWVTGPGLSRITERLKDGVKIVPDRCWTPRAATVGRLALAQFRAGRRDDLWQLVPDYYRQSAAEENWEKQRARQKAKDAGQL